MVLVVIKPLIKQMYKLTLTQPEMIKKKEAAFIKRTNKVDTNKQENKEDFDRVVIWCFFFIVFSLMKAEILWGF